MRCFQNSIWLGGNVASFLRKALRTLRMSNWTCFKEDFLENHLLKLKCAECAACVFIASWVANKAKYFWSFSPNVLPHNVSLNLSFKFVSQSICEVKKSMSVLSQNQFTSLRFENFCSTTLSSKVWSTKGSFVCLGPKSKVCQNLRVLPEGGKKL